MFAHRSLRLSAAATVAVVTGGLLYTVSRSSHAPSATATPAAAPMPEASPVASPKPTLPGVLPSIVDHDPAPAGYARQSPSHWKLAYENGNDIWVANGDGSKAHRILTDAAQPCWSPSREHIAFARGGNVWVADADSDHQTQMTFWPVDAPYSEMNPISPRRIRGISWNGKDHILSFGRDMDYTFQVAGDKPDIQRGQTIYHLALEPDRNAARATEATPFALPTHRTPSAGGGEDPVVWERTPPQFDLAESHGAFRFAHNAYPSWSPDGTRLAFVRDGDIWMAEAEPVSTPKDQRGYAQNWDVRRIAAGAIYDGHTVGASHWTVAGTGITWAPNGSFLVYGMQRLHGSGQDELHLLRASIKDGEQTEWKEAELPAGDRYPSISPDSRWLLYYGLGVQGAKTAEGERGPHAVTLDGKRSIAIPLQHGIKHQYIEQAVW